MIATEGTGGGGASSKDTLEDKYAIVDKIAEGAYGVVFKAKDKETQKYVAIKQFKNVADQGLPVSAVREINSLQCIESPYILKPIRIYTLPSSVHLVLEWKELTLTKLILSQKPIDTQKVMHELLKAVHSIHACSYLHRDLKPSNVVLSSGVQNIDLFIIDFGMAKQMKWKKNVKLTNGVGTIHFRAPELLQGAVHYDYGVDIWALGCMFYQIITREILFKTKSEHEQLLMIYQEIASEEESKEIIENKKYNIESIDLRHWSRIQQRVQSVQNIKAELYLDLLKKMLRINPKERISCQQALKHNCFLPP